MKYMLGLLSRCLGIAVVAMAVATSASASSKNPQVALKTNMGEIVVELDQAKAPISTKNFLEYVKAKHYDGLIFHRVISTFMIQGGGMGPDLEEKKTKDPIKNESTNGLSNMKYTIAMARTNVRDSATSQFFINVVDNQRLDYRGESPMEWGYAVFGKVVKGMEVVDKIKDMPVAPRGPHGNVPTTPVVIESARVLK